MVPYPEGHPLLGASDRTLGRPYRPAMDPLMRGMDNDEIPGPVFKKSCLVSRGTVGGF